MFDGAELTRSSVDFCRSGLPAVVRLSHVSPPLSLHKLARMPPQRILALMGNFHTIQGVVIEVRQVQVKQCFVRMHCYSKACYASPVLIDQSGQSAMAAAQKLNASAHAIAYCFLT